MGALRDMGIQVAEARVVDAGAVVTCGRDLDLRSVAVDRGAIPRRVIGEFIAASIEYARAGDVYVEVRPEARAAALVLSKTL